ncbi:hypothetical protein DERP_007900 [Dermatophagoides pteronyssinus]|uniref:Uncharacterized protein n=1 Tax=Dermatophagoides pteronyssinus TaxID=6956 RepID=A0ABQ8IT05_DERPT|nr:hypothetical protein DERP_007900 [Dermatophagoides pteronyssinus]
MFVDKEERKDKEKECKMIFIIFDSRTCPIVIKQAKKLRKYVGFLRDKVQILLQSTFFSSHSNRSILSSLFLDPSS